MKICLSKIFLLNYLLMFANSEEPYCSKYDFEEKVLEKMVRMEFQMERMKSEMEQTVKSVDRKLNEMDEKEAKRSNTIKTTQEMYVKMEALQNKSTDVIESKLRELQSLKDQIATPTVAFKARLNAYTAAPKDHVFVFRTVLFNEGDAYNSQTGKFTATTNGTYLFTLALCVYSSKFLYVAIVVDGVAYTKKYINDNTNIDCNTADTIAVLKTGQSVWVKSSGSSSGNIIGQTSSYWNTFSGVLLHK